VVSAPATNFFVATESTMVKKSIFSATARKAAGIPNENG
jgi:hypothetical protein